MTNTAQKIQTTWTKFADALCRLFGVETSAELAAYAAETERLFPKPTDKEVTP